MIETPATILEWSRETFGPCTTLAIAARTSREINELMCAILNGAKLEAIHEELADSAIMMWQVAKLLDIENRPKFREASSRDVVVWASVAIQIQRRYTAVLEELVKIQLSPTTQATLSNREHIKLILIDALRCLEYLAWALGIDLQTYVDAKMKVNRGRNWQRRENGDFQHAVAQA